MFKVDAHKPAGHVLRGPLSNAPVLKQMLFVKVSLFQNLNTRNRKKKKKKQDFPNQSTLKLLNPLRELHIRVKERSHMQATLSSRSSSHGGPLLIIKVGAAVMAAVT